MEYFLTRKFYHILKKLSMVKLLILYNKKTQAV